MPLYDYKCKQHGLFHELATVDEHAQPRACPSCGSLSSRVIVIAPEILDMSPNKRKAMATNERAAHEPKKLHCDGAHQHHQGCQHSHHKKPSLIMPNDSPDALKQQVVLLADGSKVFPSQRPWMISH